MSGKNRVAPAGDDVAETQRSGRSDAHERATASPEAAELARLRDQIERLDRDFVRLLAERIRLARAVGDAKRAVGLPTLDPAREAAVVRRAGALARDAGLDAEDVRWVFWRLIGLSRRAQQQESQP